MCPVAGTAYLHMFCRGGSAVEEYGFVGTLEDDVPFQGVCRSRGFLGDERGAARGFDEIQSKIGGVGGIIRKIDAGDEAAEKSAGENRDSDVRGLQLIFRAGARDLAGLDGGEAEFSVGAGGNAAVARESLFERFLLSVVGVGVLAVGIRLPELENGIGNRFAVAIEDAAFDGEVFARDAQGGEIVRGEPIQADGEKRTNGLGSCGLHAHFKSSKGVASRPLRTMSKR